METSLERRPAGWPSDKPVWTLSVFFLAALVVPVRIAVEYADHWNDLGAHYLPHYLISAVGTSGKYWILNTVTRRAPDHERRGRGGAGRRQPVQRAGDAVPVDASGGRARRGNS